MSSPLDNISVPLVVETAQKAYQAMFAQGPSKLLPKLFADVESMFAGKYLDYQASDTPYHDLDHTLQVTHCTSEMLAARHAAQIDPQVSSRQFELAIASALFHDTGYLKLRADLEGTGAKYTFTHVLRSCAVASSYLPTLGITLDELDGVLGIIRCTNPTTIIRRLHFQDPMEGIIGCTVATADYLGQMAARDYLSDLPLLYAEFEESDNFAGVPKDNRQYRSVNELIAKTPDFWRNVVLPKLDNELLGLYRFLAKPYPDGPNRYIDAVNRNITIIAAAAAAQST